jgi:hypothetical protein
VSLQEHVRVHLEEVVEGRGAGSLDGVAFDLIGDAKPSITMVTTGPLIPGKLESFLSMIYSVFKFTGENLEK